MQANSSPIKEYQRNTVLPIKLTACVKHLARKNSSIVDQYKAKVQSIKDTQHDQGITLHWNSQILVQTEEHISVHWHQPYIKWNNEGVLAHLHP